MNRFTVIMACQFILLSCFNQNDDAVSLALITLENIDCNDCYQDLDNDIESLNGIYDCEIHRSIDKKVILINIKYDNQKTNLDIINNKINEYGFNIEDDK